jgi:hypothetical protein
MAESSENEVRGLNALGNPDRQIRTGADRGPEGDVRGLGTVRPGGILARGSSGSLRKGMLGAARGSEQLRGGSR